MGRLNAPNTQEEGATRGWRGSRAGGDPEPIVNLLNRGDSVAGIAAREADGKRSRPEMAPQRLEKIESAPGNGMASEASNPQGMVHRRAANRAREGRLVTPKLRHARSLIRGGGAAAGRPRGKFSALQPLEKPQNGKMHEPARYPSSPRSWRSPASPPRPLQPARRFLPVPEDHDRHVQSHPRSEPCELSTVDLTGAGRAQLVNTRCCARAAKGPSSG